MTQLKKKLVSTYANTCVTREKKTPKLKDGPDEATLKKKKKEPKIGRPHNILIICIIYA